MTTLLPDKLKKKVEEWRSNDYPCDYPTISEILNYNIIETNQAKTLSYLRRAQFEALELYWYLRLVENTPHIFNLYKKIYDDPVDLLDSLGITLPPEDLISILSKGGVESIFEKIRSDDEFVKRHRLEAVRETLMLSYPSYIFALAMGAGKTVLIGTIIATEFAMALDNPENDFVKNALVFAPGKTILGALKEISDIPFEKILPPRLYKQFIGSMKITYTKDGEKDIPIIKGSSFNIILTNTEKIRIQKPTSKSAQYNLLNFKEIEKFEEEAEIANLRLQTIASLPNLAIFSDEAHHTYGQSLDKGLKKVRKTVDYLAENTNVIVVVNTTGTPYYRKRMLKDVVFWYGLSQGIKDGILKEVKGSIYSYQNISSEEFVRIVLEDFFNEYGNTRIYNGAKSKIAIYFPQTNDLKKMRPIVEKTLLKIGQDPSIILEVHNKSKQDVKDFFNNRINEIHNPYRVYLLVNMGTEGWNCPSLFATALARKLKSSNNFVLQAASRCLRQVPGNKQKARIYLSKENVGILEKQLKETYGETLQILDMTKTDMQNEKLIIRITNIPEILLKRKIKRVVPVTHESTDIELKKPDVKPKVSKKIVYELRDIPQKKKLLTEKEIIDISMGPEINDVYNVAVDFSQIYRIKLKLVYNALRKLYPNGAIPVEHIKNLREQIEVQLKNYEIVDEEVEIALALIKPEGFNKEEIDGKIILTTEIMYHKNKEDLLLKYERFKDLNKNDFAFHYTPYNMDSNPEKDFFLQILSAINEDPDDIDDIYFTGAITDPKKTDFIFEYKDKN
ncbi:MAG: DEAD/DEAH box helicase family protein, partial [Candidatus Aenigmarchaeota archaeon]|nr:DEAD/DEAH box helicase family protein [Candidatus Aenigmarchaeota archaeon]